MNKIISVFLLLPMLTACDCKYKIEGITSVSSLNGKMLFLKTYQDGEWIAIDSAEVVHGRFSIKGQADSVLMTVLFMNNENIMPIVLENGRIEISVTPTRLSATGTPLNDELYAFIDKKDAIDMQMEEMERKKVRLALEGKNINDIQRQLSLESNRLVKEMNSCVKRFISENYENVLGPNVFIMLCGNLPYPTLTPEIEDILKDAPHSFKENDMVKEFVTKAMENAFLLQETRKMERTVANRN